ncbi:MAG: hypothetical protein K1000chlam3_00414 [Chlamydiae bacterium]|nr:hypothetical protein [Chlamydiota bacterium]
MFSIFNSSQPPVVEEPQQTSLSVANEYICTPKGFHNMALRPALKMLKWIDWCSIGLSQTGKECKELLGNFNHVFFWIDFPGDLKKLGKSIVQFKESLFKGSFWDISVETKNVFVRSALATDLIAEGIEICQKENIIQLSATQAVYLSTFGFLGSTALFTTALSGLKTQSNKLIHAEIGSPEFKLALIRVIGKTCLAAIGIFGMVTFLIGQVIANVILLMVSTLLLLCSLAVHFYDKLYVDKKESDKEI